MTTKLINMKKGETKTIRNIGYNANKVIGAVIDLQGRYGMEYLVGGCIGLITVTRIR